MKLIKLFPKKLPKLLVGEGVLLLLLNSKMLSKTAITKLYLCNGLFLLNDTQLSIRGDSLNFECDNGS